MAQNNFIVDLIAKLHEARSRKQIQADAKRYADIKVPLTGTLDKAKTRTQIERDAASLNTTTTVNLQGKVNNKSVTTSAQQVVTQAQNIANKQPIRYNAEIRKDKLINDIKILGQQYSKLHKDANMSAKYNALLDNAKLATSGKQIKNLRVQLSAFRSELKANNLASLSLGDILKKTFKRATQLFTGTGMVMLATRQLRQAWTEAMNLDKAYTSLIKVQSELTRGDYPEYLERCNKKAKELATTQQALIESTTEFSKVGYDLNTSDALAEKATILSNVGEMSAEDSSKALISGIQTYNEVDGYTDVVNKADALISKYNEVGNKFAVTTAEIAQGVQSVGSVMADANTSVDQFIALLAATNRQYQDADSASLAIRTATLRIRGAKAELNLLGEETEGVYTSTSKLADKIKGLTDLDGIGGMEGVSILNAEGEFRNIYDILLDISKVYKDMNSLDQSALLELIAGKHRASAISALLNNGEEIEKVYATSLASAGSAQEEYDKFLQSSEASLNNFKATLTEAYQSVFDGSTTKTILESSSAILNLANSLGLIEKSLGALLSIGAVKAVNKLGMAFKASALQASNFGTALKTANSMATMTRGTTEYANAMNILKTSTVGLSEAKLKQVLANKALSDSQRIEIMRMGQLSHAQAKAKLTQMGLIQGTKSQTTAQNIATTSTFRLTSAVRGFGTSLKTFVATNKFTIAIMAITTFISGIKSAIDSYQQEAEEYIHKQEEIISKSEETISSTQSEIESLQELQEKIKDTNGEKEELLKLSSDIESVLGKESTELLDQSNAYDLLNAKIQDNINLRKQEQEEANKEKKNALRDTVENAVIENEGLGESVTFGELQSYGFQGGKSTQSIFNDLVEDARSDEDFTNSVEEYADLWRKAIEKAQANMPDAFTLATQGQYDIFGASMPSAEEIKAMLDAQLNDVYTYFEEEINSGKGFLSSERLKQAVKQMWLEGYDFGDISEGLDNLLSTDSITTAWDAYATAIAENSDNKDILYDDFISRIDKLKNSQPYAENIITDYVNYLYATLETAIEDKETKSYDLFSNVFNAEDFEESAKVLKELAISGELSSETLSSTKEYIQLLEDTGLSAEDAVERIRAFALGEASLSDIMSTIQSTSSLINDVESDIDEHGEITFDNLQKIAEQFPSLEQNIRDYLNGVEDAEDELVNKLKDCYKQDLKNYDQYYEAKQGNDEVWWSNFLTNSSDLVNKLKETYNIDLANFSTYLLTKEKMQALIDENESKVDEWSVGIGSIMPDPLSVGGYYQGKADELKAYLDEIQKTFKDSVGTSNLDDLEDYTSGDKYGSGSDKDSSSTFDWIDTQISNIEDSLSKLDKQVSNTYSKWETRNQKLAESIAKTNEAITLQDNAAKAYMNEANSVGLSSHYKTLIQKGALNIEDIKDKDLADKVKEYQDLYEKSVQCSEKANELRQTLNELSSSEKWDLLKSESDADIDVLDKQLDSYQTALDKLDLNGKFANESYYNNMIDLTQSKISSLISQEKELQSILNTMTQGTEAYDTMFAELMDIRNQIAELENDCIEFNNNIRDLDWEIFETFEESISRITEEINFLKELLSDKDMFDDKGNMTKYADATMGLHFANIETYKQQAQDYYEEMQELQKQLVNGAGQDVLEKYREYEDLYRDMISNIKDQKDAILDLVSQGYEEQISTLERINDLTLERMDKERDLYNYQKSIAEKTKEKTSLERQIDVYSNSDSEENIAKVQKLKLELEKVNSDIEELEYEKQRADTESMLNAIKDDMMEWQNKRMDDEAGLLEEIKGEVETKSDEIKSTLEEVATEYGTTLSTSLTNIFGSEKPFDSVVTAINNLIAKISGVVGADDNIANASSGTGSVADTKSNTDVKQPTNPVTNLKQSVDSQSKAETDNIFIPQKSVYPKDKLNKEKSVTDRCKYFDFASDFQSRAIYYSKLGGSGTYKGTSTQNTWLINKMKEVGYARGTSYARGGLRWTQEDGKEEIIIRASDGAILTPLNVGDKVVNAEGTSNLYDFANNPQEFLARMGLNYSMPAVNVKVPDVSALKRNNTSPSVNLGGVTIDIAQVVANNPEEFTSQLKQNLASNRTVQKMVQEVGLGGALGHNSMDVKRYL